MWTIVWDTQPVANEHAFERSIWPTRAAKSPACRAPCGSMPLGCGRHWGVAPPPCPAPDSNGTVMRVRSARGRSRRCARDWFGRGKCASTILACVGVRGAWWCTRRMLELAKARSSAHRPIAMQYDSEGIRTPAGRAQWISSPSP